MTNILNIKNACKRFGGLVAVDNVSIDVEEKKITGLIGPNGAGKTTMFNLITGLTKPSSGEFFIREKKYFPSKIHKVVHSGIARTFQNIRLFNQMTVIENVMVGRHHRTSNFNTGIISSLLRLPGFKKSENAIVHDCTNLLKLVNLEDKKNLIASTLSYGDQRKLEIARALATQPSVLALDEPAAGMNPTERNILSSLLISLNKSGKLILEELSLV